MGVRLRHGAGPLNAIIRYAQLLQDVPVKGGDHIFDCVLVVPNHPKNLSMSGGWQRKDRPLQSAVLLEGRLDGETLAQLRALNT
jgi:hypothetical protein